MMQITLETLSETTKQKSGDSTIENQTDRRKNYTHLDEKNLFTSDRKLKKITRSNVMR